MQTMLRDAMGTEPASADALQDRHGIPGVLRFEPGANGLTRAAVTTPQAKAHVYLHGAHVTHYQSHGQASLLFLSARSRFQPGAPIRGGVPVVFPWFGPHPGDPSAPMHGFARTSDWQVESASQAKDESVALVLRLDSAARAQSVWPHRFVSRYRVAIAATLGLTLEVHNVSREPLIFEETLHTYLAVGDVRRITVRGLESTQYIDKTDGMRRKTQGSDPISITGETNRVYLDTRATCVVEDPVGMRRLVVEKRGSDSTVVWNPWIAKARAMLDLGDDEWPRMLCIESGNVAANAVRISPDQCHEMRLVIRSEA